MTALYLGNLLLTETMRRLNHSRTGFDFTGYNVSIPGQVIIPVKIKENKRAKQEEELRELGYKKLEHQKVKKYRLDEKYNNKEFYVISVQKLCTIHGLNLQ